MKKRPEEYRAGSRTPPPASGVEDDRGAGPDLDDGPTGPGAPTDRPGPSAPTTPGPDRPPVRRGRPRSEAAERAIVEATLRLIEEGIPLSDLSIERIARTAGVGKATIYRRWEGKEALLVDVVRSLDPEDPPLPGTSLRDDLVVLMENIHRRGLAKRSSALLVSVFAQMQSYPRLWEMHHRVSVLPRRLQMDEVLRRGIADGEIRDDLDFDLLGDLFVGPILVRTVLRPEVVWAKDSAEQIVDAVLAGVRPPRWPSS
ncbi:TetR/AcrR family transcriptional regulator [Streptomyces sp. NBC_00690]|nr:TetR/AcrR family transcriptional regulator [Streptomyces sp. NBC_00690]